MWENNRDACPVTPVRANLRKVHQQNSWCRAKVARWSGPPGLSLNDQKCPRYLKIASKIGKASKKI